MTVKEIIEDTWVPFIGSLSASPQTYLHGDPHIGNTYVLPDDEIGFLDWQVVRRGNWSVDVGYFYRGRSPSRTVAGMNETSWRSTAPLSTCRRRSDPPQGRSFFATEPLLATGLPSGSRL